MNAQNKYKQKLKVLHIHGPLHIGILTYLSDQWDRHSWNQNIQSIANQTNII